MSDKVTLTADVIIQWADGSIVLVRRKNEPYHHYWALPGGMLEGDETIEETAIREAKEETGLSIRLDRVLGVYSTPDRDPRGRYVSVTFLAYPVSGVMESGSDAEDIRLSTDFIDLDLAFDHHNILLDYLKVLKSDSAISGEWD